MAGQRRRQRPFSLLANACLLALAVALSPPQAAQARAAPVLTLEQDRGTCATLSPLIGVRGADFPPGQAVAIVIRARGSDQVTPIGQAIADAHGAFALPVRLAGCGPGQPNVGYYEFTAEREVARGELPGPPLARATFTIDAAAAPLPSRPDPALTLDAERGPCPVAAPPVTLRGANFPPGLTIAFRIVQVPVGNEWANVRAYEGGTVTVGGDGAFVITRPLLSCGPDLPIGTRISIAALNSPTARSRGSSILADATFTVAPSPSPNTAPLPGLPNTGGGAQAPTPLAADPLVAAATAILLAGAPGRDVIAR